MIGVDPNVPYETPTNPEIIIDTENFTFEESFSFLIKELKRLKVYDRQMKKKIIVTLGPSSFNKRIVKRMSRSGTDYFRINLSHTALKDYEKIINQVRSWTNKPVCPDTEGAQLRTGKINNKDKFIDLTENQEVCFVSDGKRLRQNEIPISNFSPIKIFQIGDLVKIDFDSVLIYIAKILDNNIYGKVLEGGIIKSNKGIALDREVKLPCFTEKDIQILKISNKLI